MVIKSNNQEKISHFIYILNIFTASEYGITDGVSDDAVSAAMAVMNGIRAANAARNAALALMDQVRSQGNLTDEEEAQLEQLYLMNQTDKRCTKRILTEQECQLYQLYLIRQAQAKKFARQRRKEIRMAECEDDLIGCMTHLRYFGRKFCVGVRVKTRILYRFFGRCCFPRAELDELRPPARLYTYRVSRGGTKHVVEFM